VLTEYKRKTNVGVGLGLLGMIVRNAMAGSDLSGVSMVGVAVFVLSAGSFIWGCVQYAKGKGQSGYWGALGLFWILGLLVLFFLPDKHGQRSKCAGVA